MDDYGTVEDGFGSTWAKCKLDCELHVVRPGKVQCPPCDWRDDLTHLRDGLENGACPKCSRFYAVTYHGGECKSPFRSEDGDAWAFLEREEAKLKEGA